MSCSSPERELLTFWLAGSLGADEAARVAAHVETCADCSADAAAGRVLLDGLRSLHLSAKDIVAAAAGDALPSDASAHVDVCARCREEVAILRGVNDDLARQPSRRILRREWILGLAAAATILIAVPLFWHGGSPDGVRPAGPVGAASSRGASTAPAVRLAIEKPSLAALAEESIAVRGSDSPRRALLEDLATALEPYRRDDFSESATRLGVLAQARPDAAEIPYYLGVCLILVERPAEAIPPLEQSSRLAPSPDADYYLAVARINAGQVQAGAESLTRLCGGRSAVASLACAAARQVPGASVR